MEEDQLMKIHEVAGYLRISRARIYRLIQSGELQSVKFSVNSTRIRRSEVERFIELHTINNGPNRWEQHGDQNRDGSKAEKYGAVRIWSNHLPEKRCAMDIYQLLLPGILRWRRESGCCNTWVQTEISRSDGRRWATLDLGTNICR